MDRYWEHFKTPFLCFAGFSGVGKTTLIEAIIQHLKAEDIRVGYYKHDSHRFAMDKEGKDTFRGTQAGAGMIAINDPMHFSVIGYDEFKKRTISHALEQCDCILIEGYKHSPHDKLVFLDNQGRLPIPPDTPGIQALIHQGVLPEEIINKTSVPIFHRDEVEKICSFVKSYFKGSTFPLFGAVFVGGQSRRMGAPKFSLSYNGKTETERLAQVLGKFCEKVFLSSRPDLETGALASLTGCEKIDDEHIGMGPVGGLATLMGRHPDKAWLITACDLPFIQERNFSRIIEARDPLKYGTCYLQKGRLGYEPMCAIYEPKFIFPLYGAMSRRELSLSRIISELQFKHVKVPEESRHDFMNINTPEEYEVARVKRESEELL
ncbi:MAG: molybdopterin-guanine dinucleotide biosynthesis protein B [Nitrospinales bacterium]